MMPATLFTFPKAQNAMLISKIIMQRLQQSAGWSDKQENEMKQIEQIPQVAIKFKRLYIQIMSYQYKKSSILYELEQAIKKKVAEKPKSRELTQKNVQSSLDKRKTTLNQRQSAERLPSKHKQATKPAKGENFTLFNNENLLHVQPHHTDSKSSEARKLNNRKVEKLFSLINYALSSADKAMKYINYANFEGEFAVKLFKSDKENLTNEMKNLCVDDLLDSSHREDTQSKAVTPGVIILQEENLKLKKELAILQKENQRARSTSQPKDLQLTLLLRDLEIEKYKESIYRLKGNDFLEKLSHIIEKELKYENLLRKGHASASQFDSIFRSLISERNNLCKEATFSKIHEEGQIEKITKIKQQKQELMAEIEKCKKKLGEVTQISLLKSQLDNLHKQKSIIENILLQRFPNEVQDHEMRLEQMLLKALSSSQIQVQNQFEGQVSALQTQIETISKQVQQKQEQIRNLEREVSAGKQHLSEAKKREKKTAEDASEIEKQNSYLIRKVEDLELKITQHQALINTEEKDRLQSELECLQQEHRQLTAKLQENEEYINQLHNRMAEMNQEKTLQIESISKEYKEQFQVLQARQKNLISQIQGQQKNRLSQRELQLSQCLAKSKEAADQLEAAQDYANQLKEELQAVELRLGQKVEILEKKQMELKETLENLEQTKAFLKQKTRQNFNKIGQINSLQLDYREISSRLERDQKELVELRKKEADYITKIENLEHSLQRNQQLQAQLVEWQQKIKMLEKQLQAKQNTQLIRVSQKEQQVNDKQIQLIKKESELVNRGLELTQNEKMLAERERSMKQKEDHNHSLSDQLVTRLSQLEERESKLQALRLQNQNKTYQLDERQQQINQKLTLLSVQSSTASSQKQEILKATQYIQQLNSAVSRLEEEKTALEDKFKNKLRQWEDQIEEERAISESRLNQQKGLAQKMEKIMKEKIQTQQQLCLLIQTSNKNYRETQQLKEAADQQLADMKEQLCEMTTALRQKEGKIESLESEVAGYKQQSECIGKMQGQINKLQEQLENAKLQLGKEVSKTESATAKQTILLERCKMLDQQLIMNAQALDEVRELQASLEVENLQKCKSIADLESKLLSREKQQEVREQELKKRIEILSQQVSEKQEEIARLMRRQLQVEGESQNLERLLQTIQSMEQQIEEYSCQQQQRLKQKQAQQKAILELEQEAEERRAQHTEVEEKYAETVEKLELTLMNMEQVLEQKEKMEQQMRELRNQLDLAAESNKNLLQWKNVQIMYEKQYCNLIKRILRAIIDLDELGDVDHMNIRTLLELGSQKVIEHRMKVRDQESNEKRLRKEGYDQQQQPQDFDQRQPNDNFNIQLTQQLENTQANQEQKEDRNEEQGFKDAQQFLDFKEEINSSLISQDAEQPKDEEDTNQIILYPITDLQSVKVDQSSPQKEPHLQNQQSEDNKDQMLVMQEPKGQIQNNQVEVNKTNSIQQLKDITNLSEVPGSHIALHLQPQPQTEGELGLDEFNNFNQSQLDSSLVSQTEVKDQDKQGQQAASAQQQKPGDNQKKLDAIEMDLSHIQIAQTQLHNNSMQFENFFDFQANSINQSMISQNNEKKEVKEQLNNLNDFNDLQSEKLDQSMASENEIEGVGNQNPKEAAHNQSLTKPINSLELDNFDDFNSQRMNESVVSNQEGPESSANLDEFGDYKADEMNSSLLSERDIADN